MSYAAQDWGLVNIKPRMPRRIDGNFTLQIVIGEEDLPLDSPSWTWPAISLSSAVEITNEYFHRLDEYVP